MIRAASVVLIVLLINGCTQLPEKLGDSNSSRWLEHQVALSTIQSWNIKGRIAIRNSKESGTLTMYWSQQGSIYELRFIAPFGQGTYLFKGSDTGVSMLGPKDTYLTASTAEELMYQNLGWYVDLNGLKYWIRGMPEPGVSHNQLLLDEKGRLLDMQQSGFNVNVGRYTELNGVSLPEKLSVKNDTIQLKLIIQSWEI